MRIRIEPAALLQTRWYELALRFLFGGLITAVAGIIAKEFGPGIGGLFLAFPAIFSASATLIEKHETQKKERRGFGVRSAAEKQQASMRQAQRWVERNPCVKPVIHGLS